MSTGQGLETRGLADGPLVTAGLGGVGVTPSGHETDQAAFDDMVRRLAATNLFAAARHAGPEEVQFRSGLEIPFAAVVPGAASEADMWDEGTFLRTVGYQLVLLVRDDDPAARKSVLGRLEAAARNALAGRSYGGFTLPAFSRLGAAQNPRPAHPSQRSVISGSFAYIIEFYASRDVADVYHH